MVYFCTSLERELVELHLDNCASNTMAPVNTHTQQLRPYLSNLWNTRLWTAKSQQEMWNQWLSLNTPLYLNHLKQSSVVSEHSNTVCFQIKTIIRHITLTSHMVRPTWYDHMAYLLTPQPKNHSMCSHASWNQSLRHEQKPESHSKTNSIQQKPLSFSNSKPNTSRSLSVVQLTEGAIARYRTCYA